MNVNQVRSLVSRIALVASPVATLALGFALQACGGSGPEGDPTSTAQTEQTGQSKADLSILGIQLPEPTVTFGLGDASVKIDPIGAIDTLIPEQGIKIPQDPLAPVNTLVGDLDKGVSASVSVGDLGLSLKLPGLELPTLPDPFADAGGITIIGQ